VVTGNPEHQARHPDASGDWAADKFSKLQWISAVLRAPVPPVQRAVIAEIGLHANSQGRNAWRANARIMDELGVSLDTVKRARRAAVECGLMVVTKPAPKGAGNTRTAEYRLTMPPINGCATAPISGDKWVQHSAEMGAAQPINGCSTAPEMGAEIAPPLGSSLGNPLGRELGAPADDEPLDVTAVPDPGNALSLQDDLLDQTNIIDAEPVDEPHDPEPPEFCDEHMPYGTGKRCPDCRIAREHHERWKERRTTRWLSEFLTNAEPAHDPATCDECDGYGWRHDHGGRDSDRPMKCTGQRKAS